MLDQHHSEENTRELPWLLNTWPKMYAFVIANLVVLMLLFYWLTKAFE